jgi:hypothetical protein
VLRLLIKVKNKRHWDRELPVFVDRGDITATCLVNLSVVDNSMSAWELTENDSNLQRVLAALAAKRDFLEPLDYLVFDSDIPVRLGLRVQNNPGATADKVANETWHRDLVEISGKKLLALALELFENSSRNRCSQREVLAMIRSAIDLNEIDRSTLPASLLQKVDSSASPR